MRIRKFCLCGRKLEINACDEESARQKVELWRMSHGGPYCQVTTEMRYNQVVRKLIAERRKPR
jgi:hypothetical protein